MADFKMDISELKEEEIPKYTPIIMCVGELFGDYDGVYFKLLIDGKEYLLQRKDDLFVLFQVYEDNAVDPLGSLRRVGLSRRRCARYRSPCDQQDRQRRVQISLPSHSLQRKSSRYRFISGSEEGLKRPPPSRKTTPAAAAVSGI